MIECSRLDDELNIDFRSGETNAWHAGNKE